MSHWQSPVTQQPQQAQPPWQGHASLKLTLVALKDGINRADNNSAFNMRISLYQLRTEFGITQSRTNEFCPKAFSNQPGAIAHKEWDIGRVSTRKPGHELERIRRGMVNIGGEPMQYRRSRWTLERLSTLVEVWRN